VERGSGEAEGVRQGAIAVALFLGSALVAGLLLLMSRNVQSAPSAPDYFVYNRMQTTTLHLPHQSRIYDTVFTTTFQIGIEKYVLGSWLRMPTDAITKAASCIPTDPPTATCQIIWGQHVVTFAGTGRGTVYLEYDTRSRAWRDPDSRIITLTYPVGPFDPQAEFGLTNTVLFSRTLKPFLTPGALITPPGYTYDEENRTLQWTLTRTPRLEFTVTFTEPLLGSDLVIDRLEMSPERPTVGQMVHYTAVVRNQGAYGSGRAILAELFVRPYVLGPPIVLTDHVGGWAWVDKHGIERGYGEDALFKWYAPAPYQVYLPLVVREHRAGSAPPVANAGAWLPGSYWWPGLRSGEVITGVTSFQWPEECGTQVCGVWAKVDPSYLEVGVVYEWWGYNPEGLDCGQGEDGLPTCDEERNNIAAAFTRFLIYLPAVLRGQ